MIPEDDSRPYPTWFPWFFAAACMTLAAAILFA